MQGADGVPQAFLLEADQFNKIAPCVAGFLLPPAECFCCQTGMDRRSKADGVLRHRQPLAHSRRIGLGQRESANSLFEFVLVDMFVNFCPGREDAKGAIKIAERQLQRIYR
jgi:multiple sugar transport system substrate-binding protein